MEYKIQAVNPKVREFETKFGPMVSYQVKFEGMDQAVDIAQKQSTPAPQVGDVLNGTIDMSGPYGPKFKKEYGGGGFTGNKPAAGPSSGGKPKFDNDPFTMYLSYAKDLAVVLQETSGFDSDKYKELLKATIEGGKALYNGRPGASPASDVITDKELTDSWGGEPQKDTLNAVFGDVETIKEDELPWNPTK